MMLLNGAYSISIIFEMLYVGCIAYYGLNCTHDEDCSNAHMMCERTKCVCKEGYDESYGRCTFNNDYCSELLNHCIKDHMFCDLKYKICQCYPGYTIDRHKFKCKENEYSAEFKKSVGMIMGPISGGIFLLLCVILACGICSRKKLSRDRQLQLEAHESRIDRRNIESVVNETVIPQSIVQQRNIFNEEEPLPSYSRQIQLRPYVSRIDRQNIESFVYETVVPQSIIQRRNICDEEEPPPSYSSHHSVVYETVIPQSIVQRRNNCSEEEPPPLYSSLFPDS